MNDEVPPEYPCGTFDKKRIMDAENAS